VSISEHDKTVLKRLAAQKAAIAALPIQKQRADMWRRLNGLKKVRPLVYVKTSEVPWHETGITDKLETTDPFCRTLELDLRKLLYQWEHMQGDMVVENKMACQMVITETGCGLDEISQKTYSAPSSVASRHFEPQIKTEKDIEKIKPPVVTYDAKATERKIEIMNEIFGGIMPVEIFGAKMFWFVPWDYLVTIWGAQEVLLDLAMRPEMVKAAMDMLVDAQLNRLEQWEKLNALALNNDGTVFGSGGYALTNDLPQNDFDPFRVRPIDTWGSCAAQIFSEVSPQMHKEFALDFEMRWLRRFGLTAYGCCEPLHNKIDILRQIPNLRRISVSPWANVTDAAERIGSDYVFSYKPSPAIFACEDWEPEKVSADLAEVFEKTRNCRIEVIMKDISTVRNDPVRLWDWTRIASEVAKEFA
jgi:hypothetical protein